MDEEPGAAPEDETFAALGDAPAAPEPAARDELVAELGRLCRAGGWARLVRPPVEPGEAAFPDPWEATPVGVARLVRRLCAHADRGELRVVIADRRAEAGAAPKKKTTDVELVELDGERLRLDLYAIGDDDVAGTLACEVGTAIALAVGAADAGATPYRGVASTAIDEAARRRGGVAAVWAGLGVLVANAAFQEYKLGRYQANLGYAPVEYDVVKAGALTVDELALLVAVQAIARDAPLPRGLSEVAATAAAAWHEALAGRGEAVRARLGVPPPARWPDDARARPAPAPLPPVDEAALVIADPGAAPRKVYRVASSRAGTGFLCGTAIGAAAAVGIFMTGPAVPLAIAIGAIGGAAIGTRVRVERCSACVEKLPAGATVCPRCGGAVGGVIASAADALDD